MAIMASRIARGRVRTARRPDDGNEAVQHGASTLNIWDSQPWFTMHISDILDVHVMLK